MIAALIVFCVVILIHELGHFIAAKKTGIFVYEFAIGMGPVLLKKQGKETLYTIRLFPIGGYVKMQGEDEEDDSPTSFTSKPVLQRMIVISAGVIMNVLLAFVCFVIVNYTTLYPTLSIGEVMEGYPAEAVGLQAGDTITKLNGSSVNSYNELTYELGEIEEPTVTIEYKHDGELNEVSVERQVDEETGRYLIGFSPSYKLGTLYKDIEATPNSTEVTFFDAIGSAFSDLVFYVEVTIRSFIQLVTLQLSMDNVAGPIGIVSSISSGFEESVAYNGIMLGVVSTINFIGIISVNLAVFNFLPLPALDGGRFVFLIYEAIKGKPVSAEKEGYVHFVGFVALMLFAVFVAYKDIVRLFS